MTRCIRICIPLCIYIYKHNYIYVCVCMIVHVCVFMYRFQLFAAFKAGLEYGLLWGSVA